MSAHSLKFSLMNKHTIWQMRWVAQFKGALSTLMLTLFLYTNRTIVKVTSWRSSTRCCPPTMMGRQNSSPPWKVPFHTDCCAVFLMKPTRMIISVHDRDLLFDVFSSAYRYPFYAVQWHPERPTYEWVEKPGLVHTPSAVRVCFYIASFFVSEGNVVALYLSLSGLFFSWFLFQDKFTVGMISAQKQFSTTSKINQTMCKFQFF